MKNRVYKIHDWYYTNKQQKWIEKNITCLKLVNLQLFLFMNYKYLEFIIGPGIIHKIVNDACIMHVADYVSMT